MGSVEQTMKNFLYSLFIGLFGIAGLTSIAFLLMYAVQSKQQAHLYSNLAAVRKQNTQQEIASQSSVQPTSRNLYLENADMIGWIQIEGTSIDYPVMQTPTDPTYYLKHDFEKNYTDYGCPFMQADCDALAPSDNLIIYGHNMKDGSMFADLAKYRSKDFWQSHKTVWFDTALGSCAYEIFAVIHTTVQADTADAFPFYRFVDAAFPEEFADYVSACKARALYDTGISVEYGDKLLTLSTCDNITDNGRLLVIAKQTETEYTKLSFGINFARLFIFRLPILFALKQFTALSGGTAMGIVMMVSNGLTGLFALLVAMVVLRKEYGSGWIKLLLH